MIAPQRLTIFVLFSLIILVSQSDATPRKLPNVSIETRLEVVGGVIRGQPVRVRVTAMPRDEYLNCPTVRIGVSSPQEMPRPVPNELELDLNGQRQIEFEVELQYPPERYTAFPVSVDYCNGLFNFFHIYIADYVDSVTVSNKPHDAFNNGQNVVEVLERWSLNARLREMASQYWASDTMQGRIPLEEILEHNRRVSEMIDSVRLANDLKPIRDPSVNTPHSDQTPETARRRMAIFTPEVVAAVRDRVDSLVPYAPDHYWAYVSKTATSTAAAQIDSLLMWFAEFVNSRITAPGEQQDTTSDSSPRREVNTSDSIIFKDEFNFGLSDRWQSYDSDPGNGVAHWGASFYHGSAFVPSIWCAGASDTADSPAPAYPPGMIATLADTIGIDLSGFRSANCIFQCWFDFEQVFSNNFFVVQYAHSRDSLNTNSLVNGFLTYGGTSNGWQSISFPLKTFRQGSTPIDTLPDSVFLIFTFRSGYDDGNDKLGVYIDDLEVRGKPNFDLEFYQDPFLPDVFSVSQDLGCLVDDTLYMGEPNRVCIGVRNDGLGESGAFSIEVNNQVSQSTYLFVESIQPQTNQLLFFQDVEFKPIEQASFLGNIVVILNSLGGFGEPDQTNNTATREYQFYNRKVVIRGTATYYRRRPNNEGDRPIIGARVEAWDEDFIFGNPDDLIATTVTDSLGKFTFEFTNEDGEIGSGAIDPYIRLVAVTPVCSVTSVNFSDGYFRDSVLSMDLPGGNYTVDFILPPDSINSDVFYALDVLRFAAEQLTERVGIDPPPRVTMSTSSFDTTGYLDGHISISSWKVDYLYDLRDPEAILHEYAHAFHDHYRFFDDRTSLISSHSWCDSSNSDPVKASSEGFAEFFQGALRDTLGTGLGSLGYNWNYEYTFAAVLDLETGRQYRLENGVDFSGQSGCADHCLFEASAGCLIWDLYDAGEDDNYSPFESGNWTGVFTPNPDGIKDTLQHSLTDILQFLVITQPDSMSEFLEDWNLSTNLGKFDVASENGHLTCKAGPCRFSDRTAGDIYGFGDNDVTQSDLSIYINHLFIDFIAIHCPESANLRTVGGSCEPGVSQADVLAIIDHLYISFSLLEICP